MSKVWDWTILHWRGLFAGLTLAGGVAGARVGARLADARDVPED